MALARHASLVVALTLASRVLGFARDAAIAALFGTGVVADAAVAGLALPQLARRLLSEGALNAAIVPGLSQAKQPAPLATAALLLFGVVSVALAILAFLFMDAIVAIMAPGFPDDGPREAGAVLAGRLAVVCLPLAALAGVLAALANAAGRFSRPALAPVMGNIAVLMVLATLVISGSVLHGSDSTNLTWLAMASVAGAVAQLLVMVFALPPGTLAPLSLSAPLRAALPMLVAAGLTLFAAALPQLRFLIAAAAASSITGGIAALFFAMRLVELPLGLVGASAGAVLLPALAANSHDSRAIAARSVEGAFTLALPAALGLAVLAHPIVTVLFQRGAFDPEATELTASAVALLALTLPMQALEKVLAAIAFSHGFRRLVSRTSLIALPVGAIVGFATAEPLGMAGPALGILVSSLVGLGGLGLGLMRAGRLSFEPADIRRLLALAASAAAMALVIAGAEILLAAPLAQGGLAAILALGGLVLLGAVVYFGLAALLGAIRFGELLARLRD